MLQRRKYFHGRSIRGAEAKDIYWLDPTGCEMTDAAWNAPSIRSLGVLMVGNVLDEVDERGRQVRGDTLLILLNAHDQEVRFALPAASEGTVWMRMFDTIAPRVEEQPYAGSETYPLQGRTLAVFVLTTQGRRRASDANAAAAASTSQS